VVSLCLRRPDDEAEGEMVLSALHTGEEEETVAARALLSLLLRVVCRIILRNRSPAWTLHSEGDRSSGKPGKVGQLKLGRGNLQLTESAEEQPIPFLFTTTILVVKVKQ